jgi:hypothetical protein
MQIPDDVLVWAIDETRIWIQQQRELHWPAGGELPAVAKDAVRPFFPFAVLDSARAAIVPAIPNPPFLEQARDLWSAGRWDRLQRARRPHARGHNPHLTGGPKSTRLTFEVDLV